MKKNRNASFMEMIIILFFFALASVVIVQLYAKTFLIHERAQAKSYGQIYMEELIEAYRIDPQEGRDFQIRMDAYMEEDEDGKYVLEKKTSYEEGLHTIDLRLSFQDQELIHLESKVKGQGDGDAK
ncbi:hypothetical protein [Dubosiella newyorkensis]|uniref:hypothetical protein n=1 Tax=Dubosiella newyorkensis TaxID=1862672 RepID=UPI002729B755|nr:hypothetical protein [Dubosiella newyorkensis]